MKSDGLSSFRWQQLGSTNSGGLPAAGAGGGSPAAYPQTRRAWIRLTAIGTDDVQLPGGRQPEQSQPGHAP